MDYKRMIGEPNGFSLPRSGIVTALDSEIQSEIERRQGLNPFPLDVFHPKIKPFLNLLQKHGDLPTSYIGATMLSAYSSAIGTAYSIRSGGDDNIFLPIWVALVGISSAGKSYVLSKIYKPLRQIQAEFDQQWDEVTAGLSIEQISRCKLKTLIFRDVHMTTLLKSVLTDNHKGVVKEVDELMELINGMNQLSRKEGTDEQVLLSAWNCAPYSGIRSGKQKFVIPRPFINVIGGTQYSKLPKMLGNDRDSSGFIFRFLFAMPETIRIADVDMEFVMPNEYSETHAKALTRLYKELPIENPFDDSRKCVLTPSAIRYFTAWYRQKSKAINALRDIKDQEVHSGIFGKIKEYVLRFAAVLHLSDRAYSGETFSQTEYIDESVIERAAKIGEHFFSSAVQVYNQVQESQTAPEEVLLCAKLMNLGRSYTDIAELLYKSRDDKFRMRVSRNIRKWIKQYPRVFNAIAR